MFQQVRRALRGVGGDHVATAADGDKVELQPRVAGELKGGDESTDLCCVQPFSLNRHRNGGAQAGEGGEGNRGGGEMSRGDRYE